MILSVGLILVIVGVGFVSFVNSLSYNEITMINQIRPLSVSDMAESYDVIILGKITNVETKIVDQSTTDSFLNKDRTLAPTIIETELKLPYRFITLEVIEYLKDSTEQKTNFFTFMDYGSGEGVRNGERIMFDFEQKVEYGVGEVAIFFIDDSDFGWFSNGYTSKFSIDKHNQVESRYGLETGSIDSMDVDDTINMINIGISNQKIIKNYLNKQETIDELKTIYDGLDVSNSSNVKLTTVERVAKHLMKEQIQSDSTEIHVNSEKIKNIIDQRNKPQDFISDVDVILSSET